MKSGKNKNHTRLITLDGYEIEWQHWVDAYKWDVAQHSLTTNRHLTNSHMFPSNNDKMRNKLAEDVLNKEMLHLMRVFISLLITKRAPPYLITNAYIIMKCINTLKILLFNTFLH